MGRMFSVGKSAGIPTLIIKGETKVYFSQKSLLQSRMISDRIRILT
jgi:hypothetical protein